jgi:hypothetical protein
LRYSAATIVILLVLFFAVISAIASAGYIDIWGVYHLAILPAWLISVIVISSLAALAAAVVIDRNLQLEARLTSWLEPTRIKASIAGAVFVVVFVVLKSKNHLLGDGWELLQRVTDGAIKSYSELLAYYSTRLVYLVVGDAHLSFLLLGIPAGLMFLGIAYRFSDTVSDNRILATALFLMFAGIGQIQFFFGYVENYTWMTGLAMLFLYAGHRYATDGGLFWLAVVAFVLATLFHSQAVVLLPGLMFLLYVGYRRTRKSAYLAIGIVLLILAVAAAVLLFTHYRGLDIFMPLQEPGLNPYPILSHWRLVEIGNLTLLTMPLPSILLVSCIPQIRKTVARVGDGGLFFALCTVSAVGFAFVVDPKLGAVRDWDLLGLYALPATFLAAICVSKVGKERISPILLLGASVAVILFHTVPWIASNTYQIESKNLMKRAIHSSPHYSSAYFYKGSNLKRWSRVMWSDPYYDFEEAARACDLYLDTYPDDNINRITCAYSHYLNSEFERSREVLSELDYRVLHPSSAILAINLYLRFGQIETARAVALYGARRFPGNAYLKWHYSVLSAMDFGPDAVTQLCTERLSQQPSQAVTYTDFASYALILGNTGMAVTLLNEARALNGNTGRDDAEIRSLTKLNR